MCVRRMTPVGASLVALLAAPLAAQTAPPPSAATPAGTVIANTAEARWTAGDALATARSNTDRLIVAERLDLAITAGTPGSTAMPVTLTNTGTGDEAFVFDAGGTTIAIDTDRDGQFDPARDTLLTDGRTPVLAPGEALALLAVPGTDPAGPVRVRAATGSGTPGTSFAGAGTGGGDAVVGDSGAAAELPMARRAAGPSLSKQQQVTAPDGSDRAVTGARVTYTLRARPGGVAGAVVEDRVPAGTTLVANSLFLDDAPLTDAADDDAGEVAGGLVRVRLGDAAGNAADAAGAVRTIRFTVQLP